MKLLISFKIKKKKNTFNYNKFINITNLYTIYFFLFKFYFIFYL